MVPLGYPEPVAADWPDLLEIVERLVKPERAKNKDRNRREIWWQHTRRVPALRQAIFGFKHIHILSRVSAQFGIAMIPTGSVCAESTVVFADQTAAFRAVLQSRLHELWAAFFASSLKSDLRYGPSDCFDTFAFPLGYANDAELGAAGSAYHELRARMMAGREESLTKLYKRFHKPGKSCPEISQFRALHHVMDQAVLRAYGWNDLAESASPEFLTEEAEAEHRYQGRLFWPAAFRDEVLERLLALNVERAAEERARGLIPALAEVEGLDDEEMDDEELEAA